MASSNNTSSVDALNLSSNVDTMDLVVRLESKTCRIPVRRKTTVGEIKETIGRQADIPPTSLNIVFAGRLLKDDKTVEDYDFGIQTTLHAFCQRYQENSELQSNQHESNVDNSCHHSFYVYCKICEYICPGKLRVSCSQCGSPVFVVEQGPSSWDDISSNTHIRGVCKGNECTGHVPRFVIKCGHPHGSPAGAGDGTSVVLKHIQANSKQVECIICQEVISPVLIFPCPPGHVICLECFRNYALTSINTRQFVEHQVLGYTLPCPAEECSDFHIEDTHHFYLMGKDEYERYKRFGTEEYVIQNGGILCPGRGCGMGLFPEEHDDRVKCTECQFVFCKHCKREFHMGSCDDNLQAEMDSVVNLNVNNERAQRASWEKQSLSLIGEISKACPQCKVKTQRSGGCMHMVCARCHLDWCWLCVRAWDRQCQENHWFG